MRAQNSSEPPFPPPRGHALGAPLGGRRAPARLFSHGVRPSSELGVCYQEGEESLVGIGGKVRARERSAREPALALIFVK